MSVEKRIKNPEGDCHQNRVQEPFLILPLLQETDRHDAGGIPGQPGGVGGNGKIGLAVKLRW